MPYGVPMSRFISLVGLSFLSMCAGAETIHMIFKPLDDLDDTIEKELKAILANEKNVAKD